MATVIIALVAGVFAGAFVVWLVTRGQGQGNPAVMQSQGEIKARLDEALVQVQHLGMIFANAGQRGRAGELVLESLLEATGMEQHRDFELQMGVDDVSRPDVVVTLAGRGKLVIDAKFPLDEFQRAAAAQAEQERRRALAAHAKAVAGHVSVLAKRDYPSKIKDAIDFTVCFVPAEDLLSAACNERPELFYEAMRQRVLIATPTTLVALLWGVAYGWQQDARVRQAQQIGDTVAELHRRFGIMMQHLHRTGRSRSTARSCRSSESWRTSASSRPGRICRTPRQYQRKPGRCPLRPAAPTASHQMARPEPRKAWNNSRTDNRLVLAARLSRLAVVLGPLPVQDGHHGRVDPLAAVPQGFTQHALGAETGFLVDTAGARVERVHLQ